MTKLEYDIEEIADEFEFVDDIKESLWIAPGGEMLTGDYDMGVRGTDHRALLDFYDLDRDNQSSWDSLHEVGFVRVVPETQKALIYENQPLTDIQEELVIESQGFTFENYGEFKLEEINSLGFAKHTMKEYQATTEQLQSSLESINDNDSLKHTIQRSKGRPFNEHENERFDDPTEHAMDKNRVLNDLNKFQTAFNNLTDDEITDINKSNEVIKAVQNQMVDKGFDYFYVMPDLSSENPTATAFDDKLTVDVSLSYEDTNSLNNNTINDDLSKEEEQSKILDKTFLNLLNDEITEDYYKGMKDITVDEYSPVLNESFRKERENTIDNAFTVSAYLKNKNNIETALDLDNDKLKTNDGKNSINFDDINNQPDKSIKEFQNHTVNQKKDIEIEM